ncbi:MAG: toll/interleukin-1 receptor domain-containing protein [Oscillospiraceae bacterium]|nr:toll/interleukin-1 receptor domain-containing protein [Oscillospiraceae bacterium]
MAIIKCKMCGGDVHVAEDKTFGTCEYCGSTMTFPKVSDDQRAAAFNRGNHFRRTGEFDKALAVYERIVAEDDTDAEAHWCCALCRFGIEYVEDPVTYEWLPTCHRASFDSFLEDVDYLAAVEHSDGITRRQYQKDAAKIAEVQRGILATSQNTEPYDVFISYKELDAEGNRTRDSILAQDIYYQLTEKGWRVFFSRISLEDIPGTQYEPYIFAALNSAKVMVVVGTSAENLNAVWVKNEWSRYLALMRKDRSKLLLPCYRDMDPYDLPEQLAVLMSYDMGKIGFIQDLIRGIDKVLSADKKPEVPVVREVVKEVVKESGPAGAGVAPLLKRAFMFLEDGNFKEADDYCERVLDQDPENAHAYLGKLMAEQHVRKQEDLADCELPFDGSNNYQKAVRFGDERNASSLKGYIDHINERNENDRLTGIYNDAIKAMNSANTESAFKAAAESFKTIFGFKDADALAGKCFEKAEVCRKDAIYDAAKLKMNNAGTAEVYNAAIEMFRKISGWKDADEQVAACQRKIEEIKAREETERLERERLEEEARIATEQAARKLKKIIGIAAPILLACIAFVIVLTTVIIPKQKLNKALALLDSGDYDAAYALLDEIGNSDAIASSKYDRAVALLDSGDYEAAYLLLEGLTYKDSASKLSAIKPQYRKMLFSKAQVGSYIYFGSYEQDNNTANGKEDIEWLVLAKEGDRILVISKYALDCQQANSSFSSVTWETCSLRKWLNGAFLNVAFTVEEQSMIPTVTVSADKNPNYSASPGNATQDQTFLLSVTEVNQFFSTDEERKCVPTEYAIAQGAWTSNKADERATWWWLRSPGHMSQYFACVYNGGIIGYGGRDIRSDHIAIRPALWIEMGA